MGFRKTAIDYDFLLSDRSVVIIDLHVGKNEGDVGIFTVHVGKIAIHVGIRAIS
ncbi:hypothetical protein [Paenisporosarcina sp. NPDC076898]|uniref:hypothetical protein n=1 Tax=unclassified Paenisporosarcina TaxID=2642018 RepID=UPI003D0143A7